MIDNVLSIRMGQRLHSNPKRRGFKVATAAVLIFQRLNGEISYGIGILYPDTNHLYLAELKTKNPLTICRSLYAASKMYLLCDDALKKVCMIADESVPLDDPNEDIGHIKYRATTGLLREKVLAHKISDKDIQRIITRFKVWGLEISDPFAKKPVHRKKPTSGVFSKETFQPPKNLAFAV